MRIKQRISRFLLCCLLSLLAVCTLISCSPERLPSSDSSTSSQTLEEKTLAEEMAAAYATLVAEGVRDEGNQIIDISGFDGKFTSIGIREEKLLLVDRLYETYYVGTYQALPDLIPGMVKTLVTYYDAEKQTDRDSMTDALINCYIYEMGDK